MVAIQQKREPGFVFKDNALLAFTTRAVRRIRAWPLPEAIEKQDACSFWTSFEPDFQVVRPYRRPSRKRDSEQLTLPFDAGPKPLTLAEQKKRAFNALRFTVPREVARQIEPFLHGQWRLLVLVHDYPEGLDLLKSNPALSYALAHHAELRRDRGRPSSSCLRRLLQSRQRDIADWLGFPRGEAGVKVLRKTVSGGLTVKHLLQLRHALRHVRGTKLLAHLPAVSLSSMEICCSPDLMACVTPGLLAEITEEKRDFYYPHASRMLQDTLRLQRELSPGERLRPFRTLLQLHRIHQRLSVEYVERKGYELLKYNFPRPPVAGANGIRPICSVADLIEEGLRQHNCVASYAKRIADRHTFIYRVTYPERATLSLEKRHGRWQPGELEGPGNTPVGSDTRRYVEEWLGRKGMLI